MDVTIRIDSDIQKLLKIKSVTQKDLANSYLLKGLRDDGSSGGLKSIDDIAKNLDIPFGEDDVELVPLKDPLTMDEIRDLIRVDDGRRSNVSFSEMLGIVKSPNESNSLDDKWNSYE